MTHFLTRRLAGLLATLAVASVIIFIMINVLPGDPAQLMLGTDARARVVAEEICQRVGT